MASNISLQEHILYLVHHIFLPLKLPTKDDTESTQDGVLADAVLRSLRGFSAMVTHDAVKRAMEMMENMITVHEAGKSYAITEYRVRDALERLGQSQEGEFVPGNCKSRC